MKDLQDAIAGLYTAFGTVPRPTVIRHEPYALQPGEITALLGQPLRDLSPALTRSYLCDALYTVGTWDDFRYFLPRLLELLVTDEIELDPVASRLAYARERGYRLTGTQEAALGWGLMGQVGLTRSALLARWWTHPNRAAGLAVGGLLHCHQRGR